MTGMMTQLKKGYTHYMILMHYMVHRTSLVVGSLNAFFMMTKLEEIIQKKYGFFVNSLKRHLELMRLATLLETKGWKILKNVKSCWLCILSYVKRVQSKYKPLILKMLDNATSILVAK